MEKTERPDGDQKIARIGPRGDAASITSLGVRVAQLHFENESLRVDNSRTQQILRSAVFYAVITLDNQGYITSWNEGAQHILGYAEAEVLGRCGDLIFTEEDRQQGRFTLEMCRALEEGRASNERWHIRRDGSRFWASGLMMPLLDAQGQPDGFLNILRDRTDEHAETERRELLMSEMNHRMKNTLAMVQAIANQSIRHASDLPHFQSAFASRLQALARSHDMLIAGNWKDAPLRGVIEAALGTHLDTPGQITMEGMAILLPADLAAVLTLTFHELTTNAVKHGALSVPEGSVRITWQIRPAAEGSRRIELFWRESGGPPVRPPERRGFGTHLLGHGLGQTGTSLDLHFEPRGVECHICLPLGVDDRGSRGPRGGAGRPEVE